MQEKNKWPFWLFVVGALVIIFIVLTRSESDKQTGSTKGLQTFSGDMLEKPFAIQVCSFQNRNRAESVSEKLKKEDYQAYILTRDLGEKGMWHRVRVGKFETEEEAAKVLERLREDYEHSFIVSR